MDVSEKSCEIDVRKAYQIVRKVIAGPGPWSGDSTEEIPTPCVCLKALLSCVQSGADGSKIEDLEQAVEVITKRLQDTLAEDCFVPLPQKDLKLLLSHVGKNVLAPRSSVLHVSRKDKSERVEDNDSHASWKMGTVKAVEVDDESTVLDGVVSGHVVPPIATVEDAEAEKQARKRRRAEARAEARVVAPAEASGGRGIMAFLAGFGETPGDCNTAPR